MVKVSRPVFSRALAHMLGKSYVKSGVQAILYGCQCGGRDVDVLLVQPDAPVTPRVVVGQLDMTILGQAEFAALLALLDPVVTEPVLTGVVLWGNVSEWASIRNETLKRRPGTKTITHLCQRSLEERANAEHFLTRYRDGQELQMLLWGMANLSFSISYLSFARAYKQSCQPVTLSDLKRRGGLLFPSFWVTYDKVKGDPAQVTLRCIKELFEKWTLIASGAN